MTTNAVSGTNPAASLSSLLGATRSFANKADGDGDSDSSRGIQGGGGTLFTALLAALTQFVTSHSAGTAAPATPATTPTPTTTTVVGGTSAATGAVPASLAQDLHAFLHDLFHALRQEGHHRHGDDDDSRHGNVVSAPASPPAATPVTATSPAPVPTPVTTTSTGTVTTPGVIPPATPPVTPAVTPTTATGTGTTAPPVATPSGIVRYGQRGLAAELTALIRDLGNSSAATDAASSNSKVSAKSLADLNASFAKLIGDLGGTVSAASTGTTAVAPATGSTAATGTAAAGTAAAGSATAPAPGAGAPTDTSALQSFLTSFLQDLQGSAASAAPLGNGVNVTA